MASLQCMASLECIASLQQPTLNATKIGKIAYEEWFKTPQLRPDMNLELAEFVVMPNHVHGIICIGENEYNCRRDAMHGVSTTTEYKNQFAPQSKNIASIIWGYKSAVTAYARKNNIPFDWQSRFHDHIIRSIEEYDRIAIISQITLLNGRRINCIKNDKEEVTCRT